MTEEDPTPEKRKPSTIPSWVMLGFAIGALVTYSYRRQPAASVPAEPPEPPVVQVVEPPGPETERNLYAYEDQPSFTVVEALFEQYRGYAFWENDRTEIALWNTRTLGFTDYFEVLRTDGRYYFRPLLQLTRLPLEGYGPKDCPVLFTESAAQWVDRYHKARGGPPPKAPTRGRVDLPKLPPPAPPMP